MFKEWLDLILGKLTTETLGRQLSLLSISSFVLLTFFVILIFFSVLFDNVVWSTEMRRYLIQISKYITLKLKVSYAYQTENSIHVHDAYLKTSRKSK